MAARCARSIHSKCVNQCRYASACRAVLKCQPVMELRVQCDDDKLKHVAHSLRHSFATRRGRNAGDDGGPPLVLAQFTRSASTNVRYASACRAVLKRQPVMELRVQCDDDKLKHGAHSLSHSFAIRRGRNAGDDGGPPLELAQFTRSASTNVRYASACRAVLKRQPVKEVACSVRRRQAKACRTFVKSFLRYTFFRLNKIYECHRSFRRALNR